MAGFPRALVNAVCVMDGVQETASEKWWHAVRLGWLVGRRRWILVKVCRGMGAGRVCVWLSWHLFAHRSSLSSFLMSQKKTWTLSTCTLCMLLDTYTKHTRTVLGNPLCWEIYCVEKSTAVRDPLHQHVKSLVKYMLKQGAFGAVLSPDDRYSQRRVNANLVIAALPFRVPSVGLLPIPCTCRVDTCAY